MEKDKLAVELKMAEEFLEAAETLHRNRLYTPAVVNSYYSAMHAATAALIAGKLVRKEALPAILLRFFEKFSERLDPLLEKLGEEKARWESPGAVVNDSNDAIGRLFQAKELLQEVKDLAKRAKKA